MDTKERVENADGTTPEVLFGKTLTEIQAITDALRFRTFTSGQIVHWLYEKQVSSIDEMTNLSVQNREILKQHTVLGVYPPSDVQISKDGTRKYLFPTSINKSVESVYIPDKERATECISSQVGCKMACKFCMTGRQHFQGNISTGDILNQIRSLPERDELTNIVYMGMGEPFDNLDAVLQSIEILTQPWGYGMSPKRITVSTIGVIPGIRSFMDKTTCNLAISLHNPFGDERAQLMPAENKYHLQEVINLLKSYDFSKQQRLSFEYIMFAGVNDSVRHARELVKLLNGLRTRVNLIRFHPIPDSPLKGSSDETIFSFQSELQKKGLITTVRHSRGMDIMAACGMLSTAKNSK